MRIRTCLLVLVSGLLLSACRSESTVPESAIPVGAFECKDPRPQICTREYRPVCGADDTGKQRTFPNACTACAVPAVKWLVEGSCPES